MVSMATLSALVASVASEPLPVMLTLAGLITLCVVLVCVMFSGNPRSPISPANTLPTTLAAIVATAEPPP
ncbi:hypothetical protein D9M69_583730 [compost metagenome]